MTEAYYGIDLAWGERARTGLAVLDVHGRLLASTAVRTDDEVCSFLNAHAADRVTAAIDAPLVVTNSAGRRPCEAEVQRLFGRHGAGPYPSNLGNPAFATGTRGARISKRMGWNLDPECSAARRAIEVYPHPAMIVLLDLAYVIPYKGKSGRTIDSLQQAFDLVMTLMEDRLGAELGLADSTRWTELREVVHRAGRKHQLEKIEDEVDAIFCAHLARRWDLGGTAGNHLLGDVETGYIVTPKAVGELRDPIRPRGRRDRRARCAS